jgi:hypothetical protein
MDLKSRLFWSETLLRDCDCDVSNGTPELGLADDTRTQGKPVWLSLDSIKEKNIKREIGINVSEYSHFWNNGQKIFIHNMPELLDNLLKDN